ncbi:MAG: hypothetical protein QXD60_00845 [Nanopusillaceae archaeon]
MSIVDAIQRNNNLISPSLFEKEKTREPAHQHAHERDPLGEPRSSPSQWRGPLVDHAFVADEDREGLLGPVVAESSSGKKANTTLPAYLF